MPNSKLTLHASPPENSAAIYAFYRAKEDPNLLPRPRPKDDLRRASEKGLFFCAETEDSVIVAVAGVFDVAEDVPCVEFGGTLVDESLRGFRLQELFFQLRIAAVVANEGPAVRMFTAIDSRNIASLTTARRMGFAPWDSPIAEVLDPCEHCPKRPTAGDRPCCCDFYLLTIDRAAVEVGRLLAATETSPIHRVRTRPPNDILEVHIESVLLDGEHRHALLDFVRGDRW